MTDSQQSIADLRVIKKMMERSSRFISLSGLSGISAGICALVGAYIASDYVFGYKDFRMYGAYDTPMLRDGSLFENKLFYIAAGTLIAAIVSAFLFTWLKSRREGVAIWGASALRLLINLGIPLLVGAVFLLRLIQFGTFGLIAPGCLIFYGLALVNASKYTLDDVRYLGYMQIITGIINLWFVGYGLYFWAFGFGVLHLLYGASMWWKYERNNNDNQA
ncbi:MAG: hypothetical protein ABIO05_03295 [Ferruginibacter sp.]